MMLAVLTSLLAGAWLMRVPVQSLNGEVQPLAPRPEPAFAAWLIERGNVADTGATHKSCLSRTGATWVISTKLVDLLKEAMWRSPISC